MIQEIGALRYRNEYKNGSPRPTDRILCCRGREFLGKLTEEGLTYLTYREVQPYFPGQIVRYLFLIDETRFFLLEDEKRMTQELEKGSFPGFAWMPLEVLRSASPQEMAFAGVTGHQLASWYASRRFCPRCGSRLVHDEKERMMRCPDCGQMEYPKISPAVIVAVTNGNRLLLTKYAGRAFKKYALIAGFAEIGETIEETVQREVMEEVGLKVRNIRYYKSQPWSFTSTLLMGFFVEVDGADTICMDEEELSVAEWCERETVPEDDGLSLTREMMGVFRAGKDPFHS